MRVIDNQEKQGEHTRRRGTHAPLCSALLTDEYRRRAPTGLDPLSSVILDCANVRC